MRVFGGVFGDSAGMPGRQRQAQSTSQSFQCFAGTGDSFKGRSDRDLESINAG